MFAFSLNFVVLAGPYFVMFHFLKGRYCSLVVNHIYCSRFGNSRKYVNRDLKHQDGRGGRRRLADGEDWVYVPVVSMSCLLLSNWTLGRETRGKLK